MGMCLPPGRHLSLRCGHCRRFCGTPRRTSRTSCRTCRSSMCLGRSWGTMWWNSCRRSTRRRLSSWLSPCPRSLWDRTPQRSACRRPRRAEQLVEVPTIVSYSSSQQGTAEQIIDIPVPQGSWRSGRWRGLQGSRPGQSSAARTMEQTVDIPAPHGRGGRGGHGGLQGVSQGQADRVDIPVPRGGGPHGPGSPASSSHSPGAVDEAFFRTFPQSQKSARLGPHSGSEMSADFTSSTPAAHVDHWVEGDDVWIRIDSVHGPFWNWLLSDHVQWHPPWERHRWQHGGSGVLVRLFSSC